MINKVEISNVNTSKLQVLTQERTKELFEKIKQGDKQAREELINGNLRLVLSVIQRFGGRGENADDLFQIGCVGLIKAVDTFDAGKGRLATYACRCIDNELLMMLRARKKIAREVSLYEPIGTDKEGNEINLLDVIEGQQNEVVDRMALSDDLKKMFRLLDSCLTEREREIIVLRYGLQTGKEVTQNDIGQMLGISRSYVSRIEKKALQKLKEEFEKTDK